MTFWHITFAYLCELAQKTVSTDIMSHNRDTQNVQLITFGKRDPDGSLNRSQTEGRTHSSWHQSPLFRNGINGITDGPCILYMSTIFVFKLFMFSVPLGQFL